MSELSKFPEYTIIRDLESTMDFVKLIDKNKTFWIELLHHYVDCAITYIERVSATEDSGVYDGIAEEKLANHEIISVPPGFKKDLEEDSEKEEQFCDECQGPYKDDWLQKYGGHWDACPNRHEFVDSFDLNFKQTTLLREMSKHEIKPLPPEFKKDVDIPNKPIRQTSNGLWVGRTGGYISVADSEQLCKEKLYPNSFTNPIFIGITELEALREFLNDEKL